jgi:DNA-directed RNA polymerase
MINLLILLNLPITWTTPAGLKVSQKYRLLKKEQLRFQTLYKRINLVIYTP